MAVTCTLQNSCTVTEVLDGNTSSTGATAQVTHSAFNFSKPLSATSTPAVTKQAQQIVTLTAGAATVDLTALTGTNGVAVTVTGLKVRVLRVTNLGANDMVVQGGASTGYLAFGAAGKLTIPAGGSAQVYLADGAPTVSGSLKNLDFSGTGSQTCQLTVIAG